MEMCLMLMCTLKPGMVLPSHIARTVLGQFIQHIRVFFENIEMAEKVLMSEKLARFGPGVLTSRYALLPTRCVLHVVLLLINIHDYLYL